MDKLEELLKSMTFDYFGSGGHKIEMEQLLATKDAIFLDVRSRQEWESLQIRLEHHLQVLWIPIEEIPDRYQEIPRDKPVGVFCSAGTRSTIVYLYLRALGYENVRIAPSNYDAVTSQLLPGKLYKALAGRKTDQ
ncbi:MAG: rhodanese-like domain-containing protein [Anaerolineales bacterium]|nr:rhodanese-like domain-containing protein [Anaerolineales bacterium]